MASLIPGYEYDIFISYRQKDNKGDRWVSEFVDSLKTELESTFKEEISVYFDINPSDYLLETYDVDASLKEKLKCLVFIPIISRTYCDSKSFAWEHEFKAFVEQASKDQFGLKIKLPNGNVASRVLPVRIHDLDNSDIKECESVLGGVLRGIEFIYKESGIDKPLTTNDDEKKNLNNTKYRIQIIKVAHAIKEIILGMKAEPVQAVKEKFLSREPSEEIKKEEIAEAEKKPVKVIKRKLISAAAIAALLLIAGIIAYPKIFKRDTLERLRSSGERISVVIMPFLNNTNNSSWDIWQTGIQNELINNLTNLEELRVPQAVSINGQLQKKGITNYALISSSDASDISKKLEADVFITGNIIKAGTILRVNTQIIDTRTEDALKPFQIEEPFKEESIFQITDSLSGMLKNYLLISKMEKDIEKNLHNSLWTRGVTNSPEAYKCYLNGMYALHNLEYQNSVNWCLKALSVDSTCLMAEQVLVLAYHMAGHVDSAKMLVNKLYNKSDQFPLKQQAEINWAKTWLNETPNEEIKYIKQLLAFDDQDPEQIRNLGDKYIELNQYDNAIREYEKALKIHNRLGTKPLAPWFNSRLGTAYHKTGKYRKERNLYRRAEQDSPNDYLVIRNHAILELTEGDSVAANEFIEKFKLLRSKQTDANIKIGLASIYSDAGILNKAEDYYRQALSLEPNIGFRMNSLAYFLIDKNRNINEGMELIDKALKINPNSYLFLHTKGWGLYKQGKYQEALEILQKSWDLRKKNSIYDHTAYAHLDSAKKAAPGVK